MVVFTKLILAYFAVSSFFNAFTFMSFPKNLSPLAPAMMIVFSALGMLALGVIFVIKRSDDLETTTSSSRVFVKGFASIAGLLSLGKLSTGGMLLLQAQVHGTHFYVIVGSMLIHCMIIWVCSYLFFKHYNRVIPNP